jgi:hypothetical protein
MEFVLSIDWVEAKQNAELMRQAAIFSHSVSDHNTAVVVIPSCTEQQIRCKQQSNNPAFSFF